MKTPLDPLSKDLAVATGKSSRRKRAETRLIARAESACKLPLPQCEQSGTETLALIERALVRLSAGTYGQCLSCGSDISVTRLDQNPAIETCLSCAGEVQFKAH
ncbi:MAG: TraR/DksA C4-type zinc finger protein [Pseudomonadota bacterium]|jgi:DnaK suppressor protein|nr:TraR/DksA C4-type zinc finger protein [Pseudomonadota bacterium]